MNNIPAPHRRSFWPFALVLAIGVAAGAYLHGYYDDWRQKSTLEKASIVSGWLE